MFFDFLIQLSTTALQQILFHKSQKQVVSALVQIKYNISKKNTEMSIKFKDYIPKNLCSDKFSAKLL